MFLEREETDRQSDRERETERDRGRQRQRQRQRKQRELREREPGYEVDFFLCIISTLVEGNNENVYFS